MGIGNHLRGDDAAGVVLLEKIRGTVSAPCIDAGNTPENHLERIVKGKPDCIVLLDAMDFSGAPGEARLFTDSELSSETCISTHGLSLDMTFRYIKQRLNCSIWVLGIQAVRVEWEEGLTSDVRKGIEDLSILLSALLAR